MANDNILKLDHDVCEICSSLNGNYMSPQQMTETLQSLYARYKQISLRHYDSSMRSLTKIYNESINNLKNMEFYCLPKYYITPFEELYNYDRGNVLKDIVARAMAELFKGPFYAKHQNMPKDYTNKCEDAAKIVQKICHKQNIDCQIFKIDPCFSKIGYSIDDQGFHYFNLLTFSDNQSYIVDISYPQFFYLRDNVIERLGVPGLNGCKPGVYMLSDESRAKTAYSLLNYGYIAATGQNVKNYFDGFAISFRNGLYYELTGEKEFQTSYTSEDYWRFLTTDDSQIYYEPMEGLGRQRRPLK